MNGRRYTRSRGSPTERAFPKAKLKEIAAESDVTLTEGCEGVSASSHNTLCLPTCTSSAGMGDGPVKVIRQAGARHPDVKVTFSLVDGDENGVKNSFTDLTNVMVS